MYSDKMSRALEEAIYMNDKLQAKDLINIGLFTVLYFVIGCCVAIPIGMIPIFLPILGALWVIITGIPFMLFLTRVKKFGMVTIMGILSGLLMGLTGMGFWGVLTGAVFGVSGDFLMKSGEYKSMKRSSLGYAVFSLWMIGTYIPMYFMAEQSKADFASQFSEEYAEKEKRYLILDPRTKLALVVTISTLMLGGGNTGAMQFLRPVLSIVPFILLLSERRMKTAAKYLMLYIACYVIEIAAISRINGIWSFLLLAISSIMTKFAPGVMTGAFLLSTTTVSEFIAAMERMHISEKIVIPLSVIFRFFPTIGEESHAISDAMKMRGIRFWGNHPARMVEYRLIPLMVSVVKIGDELSAAALTRGLGAPKKRTNVCQIGFHIQDFMLIMLCVLCFGVFFLQRFL